MLIVHEEFKDVLVLRLARNDGPQGADEHEPLLMESLFHSRPMLHDLVKGGKIAYPRIEWVSPDALEKNQRTGKLKRIIDRRR